MIIKNEIPILEFDTDSDAVIKPREVLGFEFPRKAVFAFLDDHIDAYAKTHGAVQVENSYRLRRSTRYMW